MWWLTLPDSSSIQASYSDELQINLLLIQARKVYAFLQLKIALLSIQQLCEAEYTAIFDDKKV